jgi:hypothetical protein
MRSRFIMNGKVITVTATSGRRGKDGGFYSLTGGMVKLMGGAGIGDPTEFAIINRKYITEFWNVILAAQFMGSPENPSTWGNDDAIKLIHGIMSLARDIHLRDSEESYPDLKAVGYEIFDERDKGGRTKTLFPIIPKENWGAPIYQNPGDMNEDTGIASPVWFPTKEGTVGLIVYYQFVPNP